MRIVVLFILSILFSGPALSATLHVGPDQKLKSISAAVKASSPGDIISLAPGDYINDFARIRHPLTIRAASGKARLHATRRIPNGKAILIADADLTIQNLIFSNARVEHENGAGIRHQKGALVVEDSEFIGNENGILGASDPRASVIIRNCRFVGNGHGEGYTHGIYIGRITSLTVLNSTFTDTRAGHHIKSRAKSTTVFGSMLDDGKENSSYAIDLPNGGTNFIRDNIFIQGAKPDNDIFISIGTKKVHRDSSLLVEQNQFHNFASRGTGVRNKMKEPVIVRGNSFFGPVTIIKGAGELDDNIRFEGVPAAQKIIETWQNGTSPPAGRSQ
jgi:hypothetical protein